MLQVHSDSTCDVCLDPYNFSNHAKTPHAIGCGHVFCLECLAHLNHPTTCPLCRKTFQRDRIKKLHIDPHVPGEREAAMPAAWNLAQRLARCARNEVSIQTTDELIEEARRWLEAGDHKELFPEVDAVFLALIKYKTLQERFHDKENLIASLTSRLHREEAIRDEGRKDALVEHGLTQKIRELESQLDFYRRHYPGVRDLAWDNARVNSPTSEDRANGARSNQGNPNPLPSPPKPKWYPYTSHNPNFVPSSQESYRRTSIPPVPSQPYVHQTGAGAVFYEGASYDERVVPPSLRDTASRDAPPEREQARSRSGHRDHSTSAERRNRRREGESDRTRRRRDQYRRDTLQGSVDPMILPSEPVLGGNALGFHPTSLPPGQVPYSSMPTTRPVTSDPSTSRAREGSFSRPSTSHGMAPPIAGTASVPGSAYRDASRSYGEDSFSSHRDGSISRPSSTPVGPVLTSWTAPGFANPSTNSLGLSERSQDVRSTHSQAARPVSASIPVTARDSVSSWGTAESTSTHGDLFSTLRRLDSAPAESGFVSNDLLPRPDGQLLGVGRYAPIATPQPQLPQAYAPPMARDTDSRSYSHHGQHPRSQSQTSLPSSASHPVAPPLFTPGDRGFPYASVPPPPPPPQASFPIPPPASQSTTSVASTQPLSHTAPMPLTYMASFPSAIPPASVNPASRPPNSASSYYPSAPTPQSQNSGYR